MKRCRYVGIKGGREAAMGRCEEGGIKGSRERWRKRWSDACRDGGMEGGIISIMEGGMERCRD